MAQTPVAPPTIPAPTPTPAPSPPLTVITLTSGDVLKGVLEGPAEADPVVLTHPLFGRMSVARAMIKAVEPVVAGPPPPPSIPVPPLSQPPPVPPPASTPAVPAPAAVPEVAMVMGPPVPPPEIGLFDKWTGQIESGLNTASGNIDRLAFRFSLALRRETPDTITTGAALYNIARDNNGVSQDQAHIEARNDWVQPKDSGWRYFVNFNADYDEFQPWDWRVASAAGVGYDLFKDSKLTLVGRTGLGGSRELGGEGHDHAHLELTPGLDLSYTIDERSKITASFDYYQAFDNQDVYRFVARAAYDILLDAKNNLSLRIGVEDRYDQTAVSPRVNNDVEVFTALVFKF